MVFVFSCRALLFLFFLILFADFFTTINGGLSQKIPVTISRRRMDKRTHLLFYFHDIVDGKNPTAIQIIHPANKSANGFGQAFIADDRSTEGPEPTSKLVGRAQGIYSTASQHNPRLLMIMNFAFLRGMYNGILLCVVAQNTIFNVRELLTIGGTGVFTLARGFALAKTIKMSQSGNAVVEYNATVVHF